MKKTPATTIKRLSSPRQYRTVIELIKGPRAVRELFNSVDANGISQLVASLRAKGLKIDTQERKNHDRDDNDNPVTYCVYLLKRESRRLAFRLLADFSG